MTHDEAERLLVAGAVLADLAPDERVAYERHRAGCAACRALEQDLDGVLADLALIAPERSVPPTLLAGVLDAIGAATRSAGPSLATASASAVSGSASPIPASAVGQPFPVLRPVPSTVERPSAERPAWAPFGLAAVTRRLPIALAAVLAIGALGLAARVATLQDQLTDAESRIAGLQATLAADDPVVALAAAPDHVTIALHAEPLAGDAEASVLFRPGSEEAYLVAFGLPPTPAGSVYQLWVADADGVHGLATFAYAGSGPFVAAFGTDLEGAAAAMVTLEPVGGAAGEPGPQVVFGEL